MRRLAACVAAAGVILFGATVFAAPKDLVGKPAPDFTGALPLGKHNLSYRLRAEIPGKFSALPAKASGMYAPELRANSDEMKIEVAD